MTKNKIDQEIEDLIKNAGDTFKGKSDQLMQELRESIGERKVIIGGEEHKLLYIEYMDDLPFYVITALYIPNAEDGPYWRLHTWDFFKNQNDEKDIRYYNSGSGGSIQDGLHAPRFIECCDIWKSPEIKFKNEPINVNLLDTPKGNPFEFAEQSHGYTQCECCGMEVNDYDWEVNLPCGHGYYDFEIGEIVYK